MKRMRARNITPTQVYACLRKGVIDEPAHENIRGNWECTLHHQHAGDLVRLAAAIYLEKIDGNVKITEMVERLANLDREQESRLVFENTNEGWREAA